LLVTLIIIAAILVFWRFRRNRKPAKIEFTDFTKELTKEKTVNNFIVNMSDKISQVPLEALFITKN
jgi:hypothetical protein